MSTWPNPKSRTEQTTVKPDKATQPPQKKYGRPRKSTDTDPFHALTKGVGRYTHAHQFKRARRQLNFLHTRLGRIIRDIRRKIAVRQNLMLGIKDTRRPGKWRLEDMLKMFPNLAARADTPAGVLSGGEKQMLTVCRTLMGDPELIMIDEPTEGLAPIIVQQVGDLIAEIARRGVAILLVEQKLSIAMRISHRVYVMGHGCIVFEGTPRELRDNEAVRKEWLEV